MDIIEAIKKRKTCRAFKSDPVPGQVLQEIMTLALRSPSWANTQPWEFAIVTGKKLEQVKKACAARAAEDPKPDLSFPRDFPQSYAERHPQSARRAGMDRFDPARRREMRQQAADLYHAPCIVYIHTDRSFYQQTPERINPYAVFDAGLAAQTIMLLCVNYGLSSVAAASSVQYPDVLRQELALPDSRLIVLGIGIGYPDQTDQSFAAYSSREPLEKMARWYE